MVKKQCRVVIGFLAVLSLLVSTQTGNAGDPGGLTPDLYFGSGENKPDFGTISSIDGTLTVINENVGGAGFRALGYRSKAGSEALWASIRSFAVGGGEAIVTIDLDTGNATTVIGDVGPGMRSFAYDASLDRFYCSPGGIGGIEGIGRLQYLDVSGEEPVLSENLGNFPAALDGLAIDPTTGILYGALNAGDGTDDLITIDKTDGSNFTVVANLGIGHVGSLTYWNGQLVAMVDQTGSNPNDGGEFGGMSLYTISLDGNTVILINEDVGDWVKVEHVGSGGGGPPPVVEVVESAIHTAIEVTWSTSEGVMYRVQYANELVSTNDWTSLGAIITGDGETASAFDSTTGITGRIYRVIKY